MSATPQESGDNNSDVSPTWREFWDIHSLSLPASPVDATTRLKQNLTHFLANYLYLLLAIICTYYMLMIIDFPVHFIIFVVIILLYKLIFNVKWRFNARLKRPVLLIVLQFLFLGLGSPWIYLVYFLVIFATFVLFVCLHGILRVPIYDQYQGLLDTQPTPNVVGV